MLEPFNLSHHWHVLHGLISRQMSGPQISLAFPTFLRWLIRAFIPSSPPPWRWACFLCSFDRLSSALPYLLGCVYICVGFVGEKTYLLLFLMLRSQSLVASAHLSIFSWDAARFWYITANSTCLSFPIWSSTILLHHCQLCLSEYLS